jgi:outer membrane protein assembly factor BamB
MNSCLTPLVGRFSITLTVTFLVLASPSSRADELMPPYVADQLGLEEAWSRHVYVPAGAQSIVDQQIFVHDANPHEYLEIVTQGTDADNKTKRVISRMAIDQLVKDDPDAAKTEAERIANNEIRRLKRRGVDASLRTTFVPRVYLYTLANDGTIDCRNAETGQPVWRSHVGDPGLGFFKMGIDDHFVSLINGGNLVKVDVITGDEIESVKTNNVPLYGSINAGGYALVPTIRGGVEGYSLADPTQYPFTRRVDGMALAPPSKAPDSTRVAWGTSKGFVYVMELQGTPSVQFRLDTDGIVSASLAAANGDRFFFGSENGQVYGLHATRAGEVLWSRPYADPFYNAPTVYGDQVFLRSTYGNLFALRIEDGFMTWPDTIANVDELIGVFDGKLYVRLLSGHLSVIDIESGKTIRTFYDVQPRNFISNSQTDRLYFLSVNGTVQCVRPKGGALPQFNALTRPIPGDGKSAKTPSDNNANTPTDGNDSTSPKVIDPFAPAKDPFAPGNNDPFAPAAGGDANDPFGGAAMDDPFGGDDPFGN